MLRRCRWLPAVVVALGALASVEAMAATTESASIPVSRSNWYWLKTADSVPGGGSIGDQEPSNVPQGDLVVAADAQGSATKATYLAFDTSRLNTTILASVKVKVPIDTGANQLYATAPPLQACRPRTTWAAGTGAAWSAQPQHDCSRAAAGTFDAATNSYTFDVSGLLQSAADASDLGIALLPVPPAAGQPASPFQVDFQVPARVEVRVTYPQPQPQPDPATTIAPDGGLATAPVIADPGIIASAPLLQAPDPGVAAADPVVTAAPATIPGNVAAPPVQSTTQPVAITVAALPSNALVELLFIIGAAAFGALTWFLTDDSPDPVDLLERQRLVRSATRQRKKPLP